MALVRTATASLVLGLFVPADRAWAGQPAPAGQATRQVRQRLIGRAIQFMRVRGQRDDGSYGPTEYGIGPTAIVVAGLLRSGQFGPDSPFVAKSLKYLERFVQPDGGIYQGQRLHNYTTAVALMAFGAANTDGRYATQIRNGQKYLTGLQWDGNESVDGKRIDEQNTWYGGAGYGRHKRPDLSNLQFMLEALKETGLAKDDPAWRRAVVFLTRCQNLAGEHNDQPWAKLTNDGGFVYTPAGGGQSKAGRTVNGGLRSYGSMTYAGLKSYLYAGLDRDDPRVKAAVQWIRKHYTLAENPGLGQQGLYYYYHTFARTMHVLGQPVFVDAQGKAHRWREELVAKLAKLQRQDGSWANPEDRWFESEPTLVTGYVLLALAYCR